MENGNLPIQTATVKTVKDGENEELFGRIRLLETVIKREREEEKRSEQKDFAQKEHDRYNDALANLCNKYRGINRKVILRLSDQDKEQLAESIEGVVKKKHFRLKAFMGLWCLIGAGTPLLLGFFLHAGFLWLLLPTVIAWLSYTGVTAANITKFLDYRKNTEPEDRIAPSKAKPDGT